MSAPGFGEWQGVLPDTHYVDNRIYLAPEIFEAELANIYGTRWIFCAHESELPEPGSFVTTSIGRTPIVLLRDKAGALRAFLNVCPHRGATLVRRPAGKAGVFTCLFHRWSFGSDGKCLGAPQPEGFQAAGIEPKDITLEEFPVARKHGLIFVNLDRGCGPLDDYLGDALSAVEDVISPEPMEVFHFHRIVIEANWKLWAATNVELYHVWLHSINRASSLQAPAWNQRRLLTFENGHVAFGPVSHAYDRNAWGERGITLPGLAPNEARLAHVFPDFMINIRTSNMRLDRLVPIDANHVVVECRGLGIKGEPDEVRKRRIDEHNQLWGPFGRNVPEDALAVVNQMRALASGTLPQGLCAREDGVTPATSDEPLRHFHREWERLMGRPVAAPFGAA